MQAPTEMMQNKSDEKITLNEQEIEPLELSVVGRGLRNLFINNHFKAEKRIMEQEKSPSDHR